MYACTTCFMPVNSSVHFCCTNSYSLLAKYILSLFTGRHLAFILGSLLTCFFFFNWVLISYSNCTEHVIQLNGSSIFIIILEMLKLGTLLFVAALRWRKRSQFHIFMDLCKWFEPFFFFSFFFFFHTVVYMKHSMRFRRTLREPTNCVVGSHWMSHWY